MEERKKERKRDGEREGGMRGGRRLQRITEDYETAIYCTYWS